MVTIKVSKDKNDETYLLLEQFKYFVDITKVKYYSLETVNDYCEYKDSGSLVLIFYDKKKKQIKCKKC